jgi:hypothetical protein
MKRKPLYIALALLLCLGLAAPAFAGYSEKIPETAVAGEQFPIATTFDYGYAVKTDGSL